MIKEKYGTLLFSILTIICVALAIFFFNQHRSFKIFFILGAVISILCTALEYSYTKNKNVIIDINNLSPEVNIRYSKSYLLINSLGHSVFPILGIYFINFVGFDYTKYRRFDYCLIALSLYFIISYIVTIIKIIKKVTEKNVLVIGDNGITINSEKMIWNDIKDEKIIIKKERSGGSKHAIDVRYLSLYHKKKKIEFKIDDLDTQEYFIEQYVKLYRSKAQKINFREDFNKQSETDFSGFENILRFNDLFTSEEKELNKSLENIRILAKSNPDKLKSYCESITNFEDSNLDSIYYALSEDGEVWKNFLTSEFIRLFEIAKKSYNPKSIFTVLDEIIYDFEPSQSSRKVINYLYQELGNPDDKIRLKALTFIDLWFDEEDISKSSSIIQKMVKMTKDENWKIRWCANDILSSYGIFNSGEIVISFADKMKAKVSNQYEID